MRKSVLIAAAVVSLAALGGCAKTVKAPFDPGVCWAVELPAEGTKDEVRFNRLSENEPQVETCAAQLEAMRLRFLRLGGNKREIVGAYQGKFIFIDRGGVWLAQTLDGVKFFALARTGDGRLAVPATIERAPAEPEAPALPAKN
ncbi:MAG: hypothetical protein EON87_20265 [Brevundimonas sp.]|nr:MAG: hypothetical protein EON87_20265 [Brevundimonas sp.]